MDLRIVPLAAVRPHEEADPRRVDRLVARLEGDGLLVNPPVVIAEGGGFVLLDGATRTSALRRLEVPDAAVQVVDPTDLRLTTWHHVIRHPDRGEVEALATSSDSFEAVPGDGGMCRLVFTDGTSWSIVPRDATATNQALQELVGGYVGSSRITRTTDPDLATARATWPDLTALVVFGVLTLGDVVTAARTGDRLPAGITRFVVPDRVLRLNLDLSLLRADQPLADKQAALDRMLEERARAGRVRRYTEPVIVLDE